MILTLGPGLLARIEAHAARRSPEEACGLLLGRDGPSGPVIDEVRESANLAAAPARRFEIDPRLQIAAQRDLRGTARRVVAVYHSHPDGAAAPSAADRAAADDPDLLWLILGRDEARAYRWTGVEFVEIALSR